MRRAAARAAGPAAAGLLVLLALCGQSGSARAAVCQAAAVSSSKFQLAYNPVQSLGTKYCFSIQAQRTCATGGCCVAGLTGGKIAYITMTQSPLCATALAVRLQKWTANAVIKKAAMLGTQVKIPYAGTITSSLSLCVDLATAGANCNTLEKLCNGKACSFTITTPVISTIHKACCLSAGASLLSCSSGNGGCHPNADCSIREDTGVLSCACKAGFAGDGVNVCDDVNECLTANGGCHALATCSNTIGGRNCTCLPGYAGDGITQCTDVNECANNNGGCPAGATCINSVGSFSCQCPQGYNYTGGACVDIDECALGSPCPAQATCVNTPGSFTCQCPTGFSFNGAACVDVNECLTANGGCHALATCSNTIGGRNCTCLPGYAGDGITQCNDVNECANNNGGCPVGSVCVNSVGSFTCQCATGFTYSGGACVDINECLTANGGCHALATCSNTIGSRNCTCLPGYAGDGITQCNDVNECANNNGGCPAGSTCVNSVGSFSCQCPTGFTYSGGVCVDVNECLTANGGCHTLATCSNTIGGRNCTCLPGYAGDGITQCNDVNECATNNGGCAAGTTCINTIGSFSCGCAPGYNFTGGSCVDINECLASPSPCSKFATCTNTPGSYTCACKSAYTGNGTYCAGFNIRLYNVGNDTAADAVFEKAKARWESIVLADQVNVAAGSQDLTYGLVKAGFTFSAFVDDIVIFYEFIPIDGPYGVVGQAGPLATRDQAHGYTPITAFMQFDSDDFGPGKTYSMATLESTVLHEMAHSLGFGTLWPYIGCDTGCDPNVVAPSAYYTCSAAQREWAASPGCTGQLPLETSMGPGSNCGHWRESTVGQELMTPVGQDGETPLISRFTIGAMEDLYGAGGVDYSVAQPYSCGSQAPPAGRSGGPPPPAIKPLSPIITAGLAYEPEPEG